MINCEECGEEIGTKEEIMEDMVEAHKVERNKTVEILCEGCYHEQPLGSLREDYEAETFEAKQIGSIRIAKNPNFPSGTSLQAYIKTNRAELRKVFGNPNMGESGDGKSKGKEWNLIVGNHRVTIYDKREKDKKGTKYFNIGGSGMFGALLVAQALSIHRNERVYAKETVPQWLEDKRQHQRVKSIDEHPDLTYERAMEYHNNRGRYGAETFDVEFNEWAEQEMMSHGKDISFKDWAEDEGMKHGDVPITDWAQHEEESHDARYGAESFEAESRQNSRIQNLIDALYDDREIALNKLLKIKNASLQNLLSKNAILRDKVGDMTLAQWAEVQNQLKYTLSGRIRTFGAESFEAEEVDKETRELLTSLMVDFANEITDAELLPISKRGPRQYALRDEKEWKKGWKVGVEAGPRRNGMDMRISDISIYSIWNQTADIIYFTMCDLREGLDYTTNYEYDNEGVGRPYMDLEQWCKDKIRKEADNLRRKYKLSDVEIEWIRVPEYDDDGEYGEFSILVRKKEMNAERKKRSGVLSDPFDELSLDSGDWKGIIVGFGIGLLGLFGYSKLRK